MRKKTGRLADSWSESLCVGCWMVGLGKAVAGGNEPPLWCQVGTATILAKVFNGRMDHREDEHNSDMEEATLESC